MNRTSRLYLLAASILGTAAGLLSCDSAEITAPEQVIFPTSSVSYSQHVLPLFDLGCSESGCHNEIDRGGSLSLHSYIDLFENPGVVSPGDSAGSILGQVLRGTLPHAAYPISRLTNQNQRTGVNIWIQEGARNN
jgi:hypothetical protein